MTDAVTEPGIDEPSDFDFDAVEVTEIPDVVTPQPEGELPPPPPEPVEPMSAADRVRARLRRGAGAGRAASEPSASVSASRPSRDKEAPKAPPKPREGALVKPLTDLYTTVGMMLAPVDPVCSIAFIDNAESCARSLENLARENEAVRRAILALTQTSAWGGVLVAHLPLMLLITMHHGPESVADRVAPMAAMMNPQAMARAAAAQETREESPSE